MARISESEKDKAKIRFEKHMKLYGDKYPEDVRDYINNNFLGDTFERNIEKDVMDQVYSVTGVYDNIPNVYDTFIEEMRKNFDLDRNLIEVASGYYPALAERLSLQQRYGTITVYEPKILLNNHSKIKIISQPLEENAIIQDADMIYAFRPCDAIENIIMVANSNDLDLFVGLCSCTHFYDERDEFYCSENLKEWYDYIEYLLKITLPPGREYDFYSIKGLKRPIIKTTRK